MSAVVSKNLYELLGNDHDEDSDKEPEPPVKVIDKTPARNTKRNAPAEAPASKAGAAPAGGARRGGYAGNEGAFRDRQAGSANNRGKPTEDGARPDRQPRAEGTYGGRGRGGRGGPRNMDRHSRTVGGDSEKQAGHGWGAVEGGAELADEQAGEAIASAEVKEALTGDGDAAPVEPAAEAEPEDNSISYADYLIQQEEKKKALGAGVPEARKPNEGSKQDKKWESAKAVTKEDEEDFVAAAAGKAKRDRERKTKQVIDIDQRFVEAPEQRGGQRGGRGGFGGRGRGDGPPRGGRGGRGRGGAGEIKGGPRQPPRGASGPASSLNTADTSAFPSLGS